MKWALLFLLLVPKVVVAQRLAVLEQPPSQQVSSPLVALPRSTAVVLSASVAVPSFVVSPSNGRFIPTRRELKAAEKILRRRIRKINRPRPNQVREHGPIIHRNLKKFQRQYVGYTNEAGHRIIIINALWKGMAPRALWQSRFVMAFDVGSYYWRASVNLDCRKVELFLVSG